MRKIKLIMLGFSLALLVVAGLGVETSSAWAGPGHSGQRGGREYQAARQNQPTRSPGIQARRPAANHTRPSAWQLPAGWQKSMGFGAQNQHRPRGHNSGHYYNRPGCGGASNLEVNAYWHESNTGLSLGGRLNTSEGRGR